ncbi:hypothetical protein [Paenibacillus sp. NEAU-GSW1]|uniref:hypothetical protein n=1 Tax=Paenibacillus sp. NEAU-GSW1 TaxID=2682486 RepID=UPI0012E13204|nr:hypothetical protein [Paenibacillus sp. NEAU-GSW1]MUT64700.1 hypothetical protein [Paenibacillus sp. NEAU-GSW1]
MAADDKNKVSHFDDVFANATLLQMKDGLRDRDSGNLGVTQAYNKENRNALFDDKGARTEYKNEIFADKKTTQDRITGKTIHKSHTAAQHKYKSQSSKYASETDHIISLRRGHARLKKNPFLSDQDVKEILNDKRYAFREVSKKYNASKGEHSDLSQMAGLPASGKARLLQENLKAEAGVWTKTTILTAKNASGNFTEGALRSLNDAAIPIMVEGVRNLCLVASGEKKFDEATKDMGKLTTQVALSGGGRKVVATGINNMLRSSSSEALSKLANSNQVTQIITVALIVKDSVIRYVNGEIDGEAFFREVGEKGVGLVSSSIGFMVGQALIPIPYVGGLIGSMIVSTACVEIYKACNSLQEHKHMLDRVSSVASQALAEMERQRDVLRQMIGDHFAKWDEQVESGFAAVFNATVHNDVNGVANGLDSILGVFGKNVTFSSYEEFDAFFMDDDAKLSF